MEAQKKPNLFIVGAMKSGTSSLASYMGAHPEVFMSRPKEPSYFVNQEQLRTLFPAMWKLGFWRGEENYLRLFEGAGNAKVICEASANYARLPLVEGVAERILRFNPSARIVYIMRDPIRRTISHYWYVVDFYGEHRDLVTVIRTNPDLVNTSYYAMQLEPYIRLFGEHRVKAITFEELARDPVVVLRTLFRWLGVDDTFVPPGLGKRHNETPEQVFQPRLWGLPYRFRYSRFWTTVGPHVPQAVRRFGRGLSETSIDRSAISTKAAEDLLRPNQKEQTKELELLLGRDFPEWTTLHGS